MRFDASLQAAGHEHSYLDRHHARAEARTRLVVALTSVTMLAEIIAGTLFGSMALLADGFHMASHVAALGLAAFAYAYSRRHAGDRRYSFGTGKVGALAGYSSALLLALIALVMGYESALRLAHPVAIDFGAAMLVAALGLAVNVASALLLGDVGGAAGAAHAQAHHHNHHHHATAPRHAHPQRQDPNLRGAYLHVLADALTSVLAIVALGGGQYLGWSWLDPAVGIVGALIILAWSWGLLRGAVRVLLDEQASADTAEAIRARLEGEAGTLVTDLHVWRIGPQHLAAIISVVTHAPQPPDSYKQRLHGIDELAHVTVEVVPCPEKNSSTRPHRVAAN